MKKRIVGIIVIWALVMSMCSLGTISVNATDRTRNEALNWCASQVGKYLDYDGFYGAQCVDLIKYYYAYLGVTPVTGNGCDYATNSLPSGWQRLKGATPEPGDILVYSATSSNGYKGHVAIYESDYSHYNQNVSGHQYVERCTWHYAAYDPYWGVIRPNFRDVIPPSAPTPVDVGTNFYAYIFNQPAWKTVACEEGGTNVILETEKWTANQRWYATRASDGSYSFINAANNKCLDVSNAADADAANVQTISYNGNDAQQWFIYEINGQYVFQPKCSSRVLDLYSGSTSDGTNVQIYTRNGTDAQSFVLYKVECTAEKPTITSNVVDMKEAGVATISWNKTNYTEHYEYYLAEYPEGYAYTTNTKYGTTMNTSISFSGLTSGKYSAFIHSISHQGKWSEQSNWVTFNVYADDYIPTKTVVSNNHIYALYDYEMSWTFARDLCKDMGGNLVTVTSEAENQVVTNLIQSGKKDAYWLGATDGVYGTEKDFQWVTGEEFSYNNWMSGEPSSSGTDGEKEHFIEIRKSYGNKWNDVNNISTSNKGFVLEVDLSSVSPVTVQDYNGNRYMLFDKNTTWTEAKTICEQYGGHLATVSSSGENDFLKAFLEKGERGWYYIGGQKSNNTWKWLDGSSVNNISWADNYTAAWSGTNLMMYKSTGSCIGLPNTYYPEKDIKYIGFVCEIENVGGNPVPSPMTSPSSLPTEKPTETAEIKSVSLVSSSNGVYTFKSELNNINQSGVLVAALYKKGTMQGYKTVNILPGVTSSTITVTAGAADSARFFVWDSLETMNPLCEAKSINI